jgi:hypothetical protein
LTGDDGIGTWPPMPKWWRVPPLWRCRPEFIVAVSVATGFVLVPIIFGAAWLLLPILEHRACR